MIYLFAGPSLAGEKLPSSGDLVILPPVALGDVYRAAQEKPSAIGIIDGYFERTPAVSHKEILWAMHQGIHVYGAASMGALRAAEMMAFGMVGVGKIFESYRDAVLEDDDEVAVAHAAADDGYRVMSEAMVNIRATVEKAVTASILAAEEAALLLVSAKKLYYPHRTYPAALEAAAALGMKSLSALSFQQWLRTERVDQKRQDALLLLALLTAKRARRIPRKKVTFPFNRTQMWDFAMRQCDENMH